MNLQRVNNKMDWSIGYCQIKIQAHVDPLNQPTKSVSVLLIRCEEVSHEERERDQQTEEKKKNNPKGKGNNNIKT
jgi:hypothetical protein